MGAGRQLRSLGLVLAVLLQLNGLAVAAQPGDLRLRGLRGATTATANSPEAIAEAVQTLMQELILRNQLQPERVVSATFTATADLDALFPASVARRLRGWDGVPLLDMQQLAVRGDLARCIRVLLLTWLPADQAPAHVYLREAATLRPDRARTSSLPPGLPADQDAAPAALPAPGRER